MAITWNAINTNILSADQPEGQCGVDIVGNSSFPALYIGNDGSRVYFRMRLACNPAQGGTLDQRVWGILIKNSLGNPQYTVRVNNKSTNTVEVYTAAINSTDSSSAFTSLQCSEAIDQTLATNVQVSTAGSSVGGNTDNFLDFIVPSCLEASFFNNQHIYCGFTSDNENNINKEVPPPYTKPKDFNQSLCGGIYPQPEESITITKVLSDTTGTTCTTPLRSYTVTITVTNTSTTDLSALTVTDIITPSFITSDEHTHTFTINTLAAGDNIQLPSFTVQGYFESSGTYSFNTATVENSSGLAIGQTTQPEVTVTPCSRGVQFS